MIGNFTEAVIVAAMIIIVACGLIWASEHIHCFNFFGLAKGCVTN